nr:uncharacterized protein LOC124495855 [Dermatophagoides farinae]
MIKIMMTIITIIVLKQFSFFYYYLILIQCLFLHHHLLVATTISTISNINHSTSSNSFSTPSSLNCSICSKNLNLFCDEKSGRCECPAKMPVRLSSEIPCLPYKHLGDLCIHSDECRQTENAVCIATFLFSIKILNKTPSFKQWFFYNKIHNDEDMNYLLNKLYGRCRCQKGFRAITPTQCIPSTFDTSIICNHENDCLSIRGHCDRNRCRCPNGYHYDLIKERCDEIFNLHLHFCASSSDCYIQQSNMECKNQKCVCTRNYSFHNDTGCVQLDICNSETTTTTIRLRNHQRQSNTPICQQQLSSSFSTINVCRFVIKSFPLILIVIIISNLLCYIRTRKSSLSNRLYRHHREIHDLRRRYSEEQRQRTNSSMNHLSIVPNDRTIQSCSLLSLPDYETIINNEMPVIIENHRNYQNLQERLPTYEEAIVLSLKNSINSSSDQDIIHGHNDDDDDDDNDDDNDQQQNDYHGIVSQHQQQRQRMLDGHCEYHHHHH